jgi:prepilin peptidase CpaA
VLAAALFILVGAVLLLAAVYDLATLTIPNWISIALTAAFPLLALLAGFNWSETGMHVAVGAAAFAIAVAGYAGGIFGGGDAKLFGALALYMGFSSIGPFVFWVAIAGGVLCLVLIVLRRLQLAWVAERWTWTRHLVTHGGGVPYGVALVAGALFVLPATRLFVMAAGGV